MLPPPDSFDDHTLTEYVESFMLFEDETHVSLAELVSRLPSGQRPTSADVGLIRSQVARRAWLLPNLYPYRADDAGIRRLPALRYRIYDFLLLISLERAPFRQTHNFNEVNLILDFLVREAMKARLVPNGQALRFGKPVRDGRPENMEDAIPWLADCMGVATGEPDLAVDDSDSGVDVVAWQPFASGRSSYPVWLVQVTTQMDYVVKAQIPVGSWVKALDIGPNPQTALAIPFTIRDGDDRWMKIARVANQILERIRICEALEGVHLEQHPELEDLHLFIDEEIERWRTAVEDPDVPTPNIPKPRRQRPSEHRDPLRR
jgi:hypothetical protein